MQYTVIYFFKQTEEELWLLEFFDSAKAVWVLFWADKLIREMKTAGRVIIRYSNEQINQADVQLQRRTNHFMQINI